MRILGFIFVSLGIYIPFADFASHVSDIQLGIGISGIVTFGIRVQIIAGDWQARELSDLRLIIIKKEMD